MTKQNPIIRSKKKKAQTLFEENRLVEAQEAYRQVCQLDRRDADAWFTLGLINGQLGAMDEAIACGREAIALRPGFAEAHYNLARALQTVGRLEEAEHYYRSALSLKPQWPEAFNNLGNVIQELGRLEEAVALYRQALSVRGEYPEALVNLGNVLLLQGNAKDAVQSYRHALSLKPAYATAYKALGGALVILGKLDEALASYRQAARLNPADTGIIAAEAAILERQGYADQAYATLKPYIDNGAANLEIANAFAALCGKLGRCAEAIALLESGLVHEDNVIGRQRRVTAHFNLGRLYERREEYDKAFGHYQTANDLKPHTFDREGFAKFFHELIGTFTPEFLRKAPRATHGSERPIFIVGMPRSGTSLVEQILSSHPQVVGAGELEDMKEIVTGMSAALGTSLAFPTCAAELTEEACNQLAQRYLDRLRQFSPDARYVTDKMPQNFLYLGVIELLFPKARIIHCARDPLDTCVSCYCHDFAGFHPYVYRLEDLGRYYRYYQKLMQHWQTVLSIPILNVSYEALVEDPEGLTRGMLAFCGLEWDARCLRHYDNERFVNTASYDQVRKPIYKSAIGRWRHYEAYLEPLRKSLAEP